MINLPVDSHMSVHRVLYPSNRTERHTDLKENVIEEVSFGVRRSGLREVTNGFSIRLWTYVKFGKT